MADEMKMREVMKMLQEEDAEGPLIVPTKNFDSAPCSHSLVPADDLERKRQAFDRLRGVVFYGNNYDSIRRYD